MPVSGCARFHLCTCAFAPLLACVLVFVACLLACSAALFARLLGWLFIRLCVGSPLCECVRVRVCVCVCMYVSM